jgi:hypothetical protein
MLQDMILRTLVERENSYNVIEKHQFIDIISLFYTQRSFFIWVNQVMKVILAKS